MLRRNLLRIAAVSAIFALPAGLQAAPSAQDKPAGTEAPKRSDRSKYAGITGLVEAHRAAQVKMVKLWRTIKAGEGTEKTSKDYQEAQLAVQKASNKVTQFINREQWSDADRAEMNKMWAEALEKPIE
ncbi:MAG: hypothetical protein ACKPBA_01320 [Planctomycetota bacterium]